VHRIYKPRHDVRVDQIRKLTHEELREVRGGGLTPDDSPNKLCSPNKL
jgi:hypothetical protein